MGRMATLLLDQSQHPQIDRVHVDMEREIVPDDRQILTRVEWWESTFHTDLTRWKAVSGMSTGEKDWHRVTGSCALSVRGSDPNIAMVVPTQDGCFFVDHRKRAERVFPRRN